MMKLFFFFVILNIASSLYCQDPEVEMQLGINYFKAGQKDLAKETFNKLLHEPLKPEERAAVLYNLATLLLQEGSLQEAKAVFDQLEFMPIESKTLKSAVLQNQAICNLELIKRALSLPLNTHDENSVFQIKQELSQLKKKLATYKKLIFYERVADELGKTEIQFQNFQFAYNLSKRGATRTGIYTNLHHHFVPFSKSKRASFIFGHTTRRSILSRKAKFRNFTKTIAI